MVLLQAIGKVEPEVFKHIGITPRLFRWGKLLLNL